MKTLVGEGPLDIARQVNADAQELDELIGEYHDFAPPDVEDINLMVNALDARHPFMGREVIVYGEQLTMSMDEEGEVVPFVVSPDQEEVPVHGTYAGFSTRKIFYPELDGCLDRIVHTIHIGTESYADEFLNPVTKQLFAYVIVGGSEIVPILPYGCHSLADLRNDRVTGE
jgi:hypothetical protein